MEKLTETQINKIKRQAKELRKTGMYTHTQALNHLAWERGYNDWRELMAHNAPKQEERA